MTNTLSKIGTALREYDWLGKPVQVSAAAGSLALAVVLSGCSSNGENDTAAAMATQSSAETSGPAQNGGEVPELIIDVHGGRVTTVFSYMGPGTSMEDRRETGNTYPAGEGEPIECYVEDGRLVESVPSDGEPAGLKSSVWFKRHSAEQEWHPGLYSSNEAEVMQQSEPCTPEQLPPYTTFG